MISLTIRQLVKQMSTYQECAYELRSRFALGGGSFLPKHPPQKDQSPAFSPCFKTACSTHPHLSQRRTGSGSSTSKAYTLSHSKKSSEPQAFLDQQCPSGMPCPQGNNVSRIIDGVFGIGGFFWARSPSTKVSQEFTLFLSMVLDRRGFLSPSWKVRPVLHVSALGFLTLLVWRAGLLEDTPQRR